MYLYTNHVYVKIYVRLRIGYVFVIFLCHIFISFCILFYKTNIFCYCHVCKKKKDFKGISLFSFNVYNTYNIQETYNIIVFSRYVPYLVNNINRTYFSLKRSKSSLINLFYLKYIMFRIDNI